MLTGVVIGLVLGAAFSKFWIFVWEEIKTKAQEWMDTKK